MKIFIHPIPGTSKRNLFLDLIYQNMDESNSESNKFLVEEKTLLALCFARSNNRIIHIHWADMLYGSRYILKSIIRMMSNFSLLLFLRYVKGCKVIWTMHNIRSHDAYMPSIDAFGRSCLGRIADVITIQNKFFLQRFTEKFPRKKVIFVPYPNYTSAYGEMTNRSQAIRDKYGLKEDDIVMLSLGMIRKYKKYEVLINTFNKIKEERPNVKLLIVGMSGDDNYFSMLTNLANGNQNVIFVNEFVEDGAIPELLASVDYSIFHYDKKSMMNSGGVQLSLSYGVPVVLPSFITDHYITNDNAIVFSDREELLDLLRKISPTEISAEKISESIASRSPFLVRKQLREVYLQCFI